MDFRWRTYRIGFLKHPYGVLPKDKEMVLRDITRGDLITASKLVASQDIRKHMNVKCRLTFMPDGMIL